MNDTIVAVFDTEAHAEAAVHDLEAAGVPSTAITQHSSASMMAGSATTTTTTGVAAREPGFWSSLFGGDPEHTHDTTVYDRSLQSGSVVVTVQAHEEHMTMITDILERHHPIDIDERAATYAADTTTTTTTTAMGTGHAAPTATTGLAAGANETIQLAEETLAVGKRAVNRGTTRIRRYVVETPVEEHVSLRDETVSVQRRPVTDGRPITDAHFTDQVIEMTETDEEVVVAKTAHVTEEIVLRKDTTERVETVRDTVRREEVEITKDAGVEHTASTTAVPPTAPYNPKV